MHDDREFIQLHSPEAEQAVLGGLLLDNLAWDKVSDTLAAEQFFDPAHRYIAQVLFAMLSDGKPADVVTVGEALDAQGKLDAAGGFGYLATMAQNTPSAANIRRYASILLDKTIARQAIHITGELVGGLQTPKGVKSAELVDRAAGALEMLTTNRGSEEKTLDAVELARRTIENIDRRYTMPEGEMDGTPTGFAELDQRMGGMQPGELIIIAGRPAMGKTVMGINIAEHVSRFIGPAFVFSQEMDEKQLGDRQVASLAGIPLNRVRSGRFEDEDWQRLTYYAGVVQELRMQIDFRAQLTPEQVRNKCRQLARRHGRPALIVIDYLQLMRGPGHGSSDNRNYEIGYISAALKALAKEMGCPVVVLSQLSRAVESRANKRPMMSDLRDSGAIEQDADAVLFPYRDEYYNPDSPDIGTVEIIIGKLRQGEVKPVRLGWEGQYVRMTNLQAGWAPRPAIGHRKHSGGFDE
ncbi:replicative DNA helicase [Chromobacterium paludis]|uniref:Replicative DNA helicase n=1 Tax=Chromobacterium paludis TaxID=2605945 RepID=A0A5C1DFQ7_9NEIS|nr:replicative DNA helicase [Chromobacterium paludis]QEL55486.1 replicative DNA helicase [Chromobacterium paludis]